MFSSICFLKHTVRTHISLRAQYVIFVVGSHCISRCSAIHVMVHRTLDNLHRVLVDWFVDPVLLSLYVRLLELTEELRSISEALRSLIFVQSVLYYGFFLPETQCDAGFTLPFSTHFSIPCHIPDSPIPDTDQNFVHIGGFPFHPEYTSFSSSSMSYTAVLLRLAIFIWYFTARLGQK